MAKILKKLFNKFSTSKKSKTELLKYTQISSTLSSSNIVPNQTLSNIHVQQLGFPEPLLFYLKKNANPKLLLKLMQSSKRHFSFKEFPFFATHFLSIDKADWIYYDQRTKSIKTLDLQNLSKPLWITNGINCNTFVKSRVISNLLSKTFICDIKFLRLVSRILSVEQFVLLNSKKDIEYLTFINSHVEYSDGEIVPLNEILNSLPNVKNFYWLFSQKMASTLSSESTQNLIDSLKPSTLTSFTLMNIPQNFDFKLFTKFMKKNPWIDFFLEFNNTLSSKYSFMLQKFVDKLIKTSPKKYRPIRIRFIGQTEKLREALDTLYKLHSQQLFVLR